MKGEIKFRNSEFMKIRRAKPEDAEKLSEIAFAAKSYWKYPEKWLELWKDDLTITLQNIAENEVYEMTENDEIVGFYVLIIKDNSAQLEHLWIKPENIGAGIGRKLFAHALKKAVSLRAEKIYIASDPHAEGFYKKMGAKRIGNFKTEVDGNERFLPLMEIEL